MYSVILDLLVTKNIDSWPNDIKSSSLTTIPAEILNGFTQNSLTYLSLPHNIYPLTLEL